MTIVKRLEGSVAGRSYVTEVITLPAPIVTFIDGPRNPVETVSRLVQGYSGNYDPDFMLDLETVKKAIEDISNTKLKTPLEMGTFVFLLNDVPRSWTHQLVRTRIGASFVQESMRFMGHKGIYKVLLSKSIVDNPVVFNAYCEAIEHSMLAYEIALNRGVSSEDARSILPTDIITSIFIGYQMSTFAAVYEQRMCCQAQPGVWQNVMKQMRDQLEYQYGPYMKKLISAPYERGEPCGYRASFDRPCTWQKKKEQNDNPSL